VLLCIGLSFSLLLLCTPLNPLALTFEKLPVSNSTQQWKVEIGEADKQSGNGQGDSKEYNEYSLDIKNIGDKSINLERIEVYRNEPNSNTKFELLTDERDDLKTVQSFHHENLPVSLSANKLEVIITWSKKVKQVNSVRKYQETFVFETK
jgi:hypothetical protein